mmetsp:Transcript_27440/g.54904  ORF Transcript_27440/g.54904 Transcript_27440/m.54904 type:complete len:88 (+) Transcript_27440:1349-1612(+)
MRSKKKEKPQQQSQQDGETSEAKSGKEENPLESAVKKEELKKIIDEVNDLNKTKSQMIWLLKQVSFTVRFKNYVTFKHLAYVNFSTK